ncbi:NAD(P)-binding protein [Microthyrium microscopicum]|uniref:NAD(P)-binding protein n=1 Tax=Microthyrium microscopicum TaxID=703497 RepID=A0A6A6UGC5_9PEZI|nr:NAD(P)-binding protein [Microthyrium microscopicum]
MPPIPKISSQSTLPATALITGGASGIGLAIAHKCRAKGMRVGIVDRNTKLLARAKDDLASGAPEDVLTFDVDVTNTEDWEKLKGDVERAWGQLGFLFLNAGIGGKGDWGDREYFQRILNTNLFGVVNGLNTFVPFLKAQSGYRSSIVITGSKQGITNPPGNPAYNASKAAVKSLAEHLSYDLKDTDIGVHLLVPGWTFTGLSGNVPGSEEKKPDGAWSPEQVADYCFQKMNDGKFYIICPDNDVTPELDKKRMMWTAGDAVYERQPLTRWRKEYAEESKKWMEENSF